MERELTELMKVLEEQRDHQAALAGLSERKMSVITQGDAAALQGIVEEEKAVLAGIRAVEAKQGRCVGRLSAVMGVPVDEVRMSLIIDKAEDGMKERLVCIRGELSELIEKQLKFNEINMKLLQMNMDYVQFLFNTASSRQAGTTYGNGGSLQRAAGSSRRLLDRKV